MKPRNRLFQKPLAVTITAAALALQTSALHSAVEVLYEETFNTDGDGSRYSMEGRAAIENVDGQIGPGFWDLSSNVSFVGIPNEAPSRRALFLWHHDIAPEAMTEEALELFDSTVAWLLDDRSNATILYTAAEDPTNGDGVLLDRLESQGHAIHFDVPDMPVPDPSGIDMVLKSSGSGNSSPNRFTLYPVPMLSYSGADHDDTLLSSNGPTKTFDPGAVVIESPGHPAAGGKTSPIELVSGEQPFSTIGVSLPEEATVVASYRLERFQPVNSLSDVDRMIKGALPAITHTASLEAADLIGGEFGVGGNWETNLRPPGDPIGGFAVAGQGELEVVEAGIYTFALRVNHGGRLRVDLNGDGLNEGDDVIVADGTSGLFFEDVSFPAAGMYPIEWVSFNAEAASFGSEISVAFTEGGGVGTPVNADSWDLLGAPLAPPPVRLNGVIEATTYILDEDPIIEHRPALVAIEEGGPMFGGGLIESPDGSNFIGAAALARFASDTGLSAADPYSLTLQPVDVSGKENVRLSFLIAGTFVDFETADFLRVLIDIDGDGPAGFEVLADFSGDGAGALTDGTTRVVREFQEVSYPIPGEATELVVRFEAWNTWFNEIAAFDNVIITAGVEEEAPRLSISRGSEGAVIEFEGTLQSAAALDGNWTDVEGAVESPFVVPFDTELGRRFFRAR